LAIDNKLKKTLLGVKFLNQRINFLAIEKNGQQIIVGKNLFCCSELKTLLLLIISYLS